MLRKLFAAAGAAAAAGALVLAAGGPAHASTSFVAVTHLTNRPDSGNNANNGGNWAIDTLTRTATLTDQGADPNRPGYDTYTFGLSDTGTFVDDAGVASNPNGLNPLTLIKAASGSVNGTGTWTTFDVLHSVHPSTAGVPASEDGSGTSSSKWLAFFFPKYTSTSTCPGVKVVETAWTTQEGSCGQETQFSYLYKSCSEHWLDASSDNSGNAQGVTSETDLDTIGGISGKDCPAPVPTPTPTGSTTPPPTGVPSGGVQTGGGLSHTSPLLPVGIVLVVVGFLGMGFGLALRTRKQH
jgi:hypothetical protein